MRPGQHIISPAERGRGVPRDRAKVEGYEKDKVYVTPHYDTAYTFAGSEPGKGYVYEVEPIGDLSPDSDLSKSGLEAYTAGAARIKSVVKKGQNVTTYKGKSTPALASEADKPSSSRTLYPNAREAKCTSCGVKVPANEGVYVKTGRKQAGAKKFEVYHKDHLEN